MKLVKKMNGRIQELDEKLAAIMRGANSSTSASTSDTAAVQSHRSGEINPSTLTQVCALGNTVNSVNTAKSVSAVAVANDQSLIPLMAVGTEWASVAASSPVSTANRFTALFDKQSVCPIFVESSSTFLIFFDNDAYAFTSTRRNFFPRLRKGFDLDESMFFHDVGHYGVSICSDDVITIFPRLALVLNYIPRPLCLSKVAPLVGLLCSGVIMIARLNWNESSS